MGRRDVTVNDTRHLLQPVIYTGCHKKETVVVNNNESCKNF